MRSSGPKRPLGLRWRANSLFILTTVAVGMFTDLFLYGLVVPILPFMLKERMGLADDKIQSYVSGLLAAYAGASVIFSIPVGIVADRTNARRTPFLCGLAALLAATLMLALGRNIAMLVVARILQGTSAAVVWTVGLAMVLDTVGPNHLGKVIGSIFSFISVGELAAPVLGGVLYRKTGYLGVFGLGSALLAVDFLLRVLVVETKVAVKYEEEHGNVSSPESQDQDPATMSASPGRARGVHQRGSTRHGTRGIGIRSHNGNNKDSSEEDALLPKKARGRGGADDDDDDDDVDLCHYFIPPESQNGLIRAMPILYCLGDARLLVALLLAFVQAFLLATFDATIPTEAQSLFDFDSLQAGLLFIALDIPYLLCGPIAGWAVDKYGTKPASVLGFGYLVPTLILLRLPTMQVDQNHNHNKIIAYCALLALNGIGLAAIGSPSIVEASAVMQKYAKANSALFGQNGPYAQLYAFNSVVFSAGLTIGPVVSGALRDRIGYADMNAAVAAVSGLAALLSFLYVGGKPKLTLNWRRVLLTFGTKAPLNDRDG
ncbi:hypothetical protein HRR83_006163 [Exophiala dermatitidis]|uniref:Major facilitator superfamily (MFS) profile domain-containing protein n=2 Tax=Exophiala dermatitidis TaxID=5970 RepID=H6BMC0_EXODN|nr:uncharacterized protein HMPREF1120_01202 [Exophiala dermatitidis NIH/UT8656]KAJ4512193.1 hypothetical protein HRR75_005093 [Exophiala dermatitidis]EHY53001.1 hypothetical protein HMPREF1120_01202 [Exophiala dermatitidis NIH/UT8656]KAJ4515095.1 hypothetical protein HRR74_005560 [Exophiala dermatitidis]KAJ4517587.1 hypothetical protein HRR73_004639 [Exophiala dermatitidis]KAJ4548654.1 hypothetical protein HRR76_001243 [Exophiala dermatitidis]